MDEIRGIAADSGITVIEDAAHAFPAKYRSAIGDWRNAGTMSKIGCFSFYANKCITTAEGGMAVTDDEETADRLRVMSLHGMNKDAWKRYSDKGNWYYEIVAPGFKYNLTDIAAAIGLHQLRKAEDFRLERERIAGIYSDAFREIEGLETPATDPVTRVHSWHLYSLRLDLDRLSIDRAEFIERLKARGVSCSVHWQPLHLQPYYRSRFGLDLGIFPIAEKEWLRLVSLPIFPGMTEEEISHVIESVKQIVFDNMST
jgi:perosamine synthetase